MSLFERIGGEKLRAVLTDFYDRVFADVMIGYLFSSSDKQHLIDREWEFAARLLGGDVKYTGKSMPRAHAHLAILGGHFDRRLQILRETLADHDVDPAVRDHWIEHSAKLRAQITADPDSACNHERAAQRLAQNRELFRGS